MKMNIQTKHTPGPWKSEVPPSSAMTCRDIRGPDGQHVAKIGWMDYSEGQETDLANARLIAAAPELLEALENLSREMESRFEHETATHAESAAMNNAILAIAKATGN